MIGNGCYYEDTVQFECNDGFMLVGDDTAECLDNGNWSVEIPNCERKF